MAQVRTRIAPSPTGELHIGHMRTILFDYALAKKYGGQFIVRIEDTDRKRFVEGSIDRTLDVIKSFGLTWDEGPRVGGEVGPYIQSERLEIYEKYAKELIEKDKAYYCFLTPEETKQLQETCRLQSRKLRSPFRNSTKKEIDELLKSKKPYVIRLKVTEGRNLKFHDEVLGDISFNTSEVDDQVLIKSDGFPTYHLAVVVDDHLMNISHVLRGNDWLPSTPKQILLYEAFGWELPKFIHLPNLKEKGEGTKMSKRKGAVFAVQFLELGYLPDAILNFLMLLGWSSPIERVPGEPEREIYSVSEFTKLFDIDRVQKTSLVAFDRDKLVWFNKEYLKNKSAQELSGIFVNWLENYARNKSMLEVIKTDEQLASKLALVKERSATLVDILDQIKFFYQRPQNINWKIQQLTPVSRQLSALREEIYSLINSFGDDNSKWSHELWENGMRAIGDKFGFKHGDIFMVLRVAVSGAPFSPPLFEAIQILGKEETLERLKTQHE